MAGPIESGRTQAILAALRTSELFRTMDDDAGARLFGHLATRRFRKDEVVFHQGDPGDRLHVVETGRVRIGLEAQDGREGTLTVLGPGRVFGELVLLDGAPRSATAVALEVTTTVTLDRAAFQSLVLEDAAFREAILGGMARWVRRLTDQVAELHFLDLRGRTASTLVRMARESDTPPGTPVELPALTQGVLATLVAGTRQRVNGALAELQADGLIDYDGKHVTVRDVDRLAHSVEW